MTEIKENIGQLRVGKCTYKNGQRIDPIYPGFATIVCLTKSSAYGSIGPYVLKDENGRLMENIWQFSKIYEKVPYSRQTYSKYQPRVTWEWPADTHIIDGKITNEYYEWRKQGMEAKDQVRYPVGIDHRHTCKGVILEDDAKDLSTALGKIESRKKLYIPLYCRLAKEQLQFKNLYKRLRKGENLLICEVDVAFAEDMQRYKEEFGVADNFIEKNTMLINKTNIEIVLHDIKRPFGHGYCLALALLDKDVEWTEDDIYYM